MANEERLKILDMLEQGKISAEEATTLLRALEGRQRAGAGPTSPPGSENRFLRIQVTDMASGASKVHVTIPVGLVSAGLRMAERFAPDVEGFELEELGDMIASGAVGKVIEVVDPEDNERVEIYVE